LGLWTKLFRRNGRDRFRLTRLLHEDEGTKSKLSPKVRKPGFFGNVQNISDFIDDWKNLKSKFKEVLGLV
jgi:hypothetical protein